MYIHEPKNKYKTICSCCGSKGEIYTEVYKDNEGNLCKKCHIQELRSAVKSIEESKRLIEKSLSPNNLYTWNTWTSQRRKLCVFQMHEAGMIKYKIH